MTKVVTVEHERLRMMCPVCMYFVLYVFRDLKVRVDIATAVSSATVGAGSWETHSRASAGRAAAVLVTPRAARPGCRSSWASRLTFHSEHADQREKTAELPP